MFEIARIDRLTNEVVNIEVADQDWLDANASDPDFLFVPYTPAEPVAIGGTYAPELSTFIEPLSE